MREHQSDARVDALRRRYLLTVGAALASTAVSGLGYAASYPNRPIRLIVPFPPGGPVDLMGRAVGQIINQALSQPVVVENRPGAGGNIGIDVVAKSPADGYTLGIGAISSLSIAPAMGIPTPYNVDKDLTHISLIGKVVGAIIANPSVPFDDLPGLIAYAKQNPGKLSYASSGPGTSSHLAGEYLASRAGIQWVHIPYKGTAPAVQDLIGGQVPIYFETSLAAAAQHATSGRVKAIAITGPAQSPLLPGVKTVAEQGISDFDVSPWMGLVGAAGMPAEVTSTLNAALTNGLKSEDIARRFSTFGGVAEPSTPEQFRRFVQAETQRWTRIVQQAGIKPG